MIIKGKRDIVTQINNEVVKYGTYICGRNKFNELYILREVKNEHIYFKSFV